MTVGGQTPVKLCLGHYCAADAAVSPLQHAIGLGITHSALSNFSTRQVLEIEVLISRIKFLKINIPSVYKAVANQSHI